VGRPGGGGGVTRDVDLRHDLVRRLVRHGASRSRRADGNSGGSAPASPGRWKGNQAEQESSRLREVLESAQLSMEVR
jgi:hypothetical protein